MSENTKNFAEFGTQKRIAFRLTQGKAQPGLFWLSGFNSSMDGTKATALAAWARQTGKTCTRFDYSGHGASEGTLEEGTISAWRREAIGMFEHYSEGPQIIIGSSMGGWLAMLLYRHLKQSGQADRVNGLVLIAPAADMTEELMWQRYSAEIRNDIMQAGVWHRPSAYGDGDYPITRKLIEDGHSHLILGEKTAVSCPVRILHGDKDPDVPWQHGLRLYEQLEGDDVTFTLIKGGDHRLSSQAEIGRLLTTISALA